VRKLYRDVSSACEPGLSLEKVWCWKLWRRLTRLAGFYAEREELRSREAYNLACSVILRRLIAAASNERENHHCAPLSH